MDVLEVVKGLLTGMNFGQIIAYLIGGMFLKALLDMIFLKLLGKYWPDKAFQVILTKIVWFENKVIDPFEEKYPKAGALVRKKMAKFLDDAEKIILDD